MCLTFAVKAEFPYSFWSHTWSEYPRLNQNTCGVSYLGALSGPGLSHDVWAAWRSCHRTSRAQTWSGPQTGWCRPAGDKVWKIRCRGLVTAAKILYYYTILVIFQSTFSRVMCECRKGHRTLLFCCLWPIYWRYNSFLFCNTALNTEE